MKILRPLVLMLTLTLTLAPSASAASPLETFKTFQTACLEKREEQALALIMPAPGSSPQEDAYFTQKAKRFTGVFGNEEEKIEVVSQKVEGDCAVVIILTMKGDHKDYDAVYLVRDKEEWRINPFTNWKKLDLAPERKMKFETLEKWYEEEEKRLMPPVE